MDRHDYVISACRVKRGHCYGKLRAFIAGYQVIGIRRALRSAGPYPAVADLAVYPQIINPCFTYYYILHIACRIAAVRRRRYQSARL